jgi:hypothetical protein
VVLHPLDVGVRSLGNLVLFPEIIFTVQPRITVLTNINKIGKDALYDTIREPAVQKDD